MSVINLPYVNSPTVPLACTDVSANIALPCSGAHVLVSNIGSYPAWISSGVGNTTSSTASTGNGVCIAAGSVQSLRISPLDTYIAGVCASGQTTTLSISVTIGS